MPDDWAMSAGAEGSIGAAAGRGPGIFTGDGTHAVAQYDRTMKRLTSVFTRDYVRFALGSDVGSAEPLAVEEQDKELPALSREVDAVSVMEQDLAGLYPLLPLMRWEEGSEPAAIPMLDVDIGCRGRLCLSYILYDGHT